MNSNSDNLFARKYGGLEHEKHVSHLDIECLSQVNVFVNSASGVECRHLNSLFLVCNAWGPPALMFGLEVVFLWVHYPTLLLIPSL